MSCGGTGRQARRRASSLCAARSGVPSQRSDCPKRLHAAAAPPCGASGIEKLPLLEESAAAAPQPLSCTSKSRQCQGQSRLRRCIRILDIVGISMFASAYEVRRQPVGNTDECLQMPILRHHLPINTKCRCKYIYSGICLEDNSILETPKGVNPSFTPISRWARRRSLYTACRVRCLSGTSRCGKM